MKYQLSQKLFTFGDDFTIRNETGRELYYVDGKAFTFGKKLSFLDEQKKELVFISQKLFTFAPTFQIKKHGQIIATVKKQLFTMRPKFILDIPGPNDYHVVGDFIGHEYTIKRNSKDVARVSKQFFSMSDTYGVDIVEGDTVLILSAVIIIDLVLHVRRKSSH